jgi:hypothetical protein
MEIKTNRKSRTKGKIGNGGNKNLGKHKGIYTFGAKDRIVYVKNREAGFETIVKFIEEHTGVTQEVMKSNTRIRIVSDCRCLFYHLSRTYLDASYDSMAKYMNRDHSTAVHAIKNIHPVLLSCSKSYSKMIIDFSLLYNKELLGIKPKDEGLEDIDGELDLISKNNMLIDEIVSLKKTIYDMRTQVEQSDHILTPVINKIPTDKLYLVKERLEAIVKML